MARTWVNFADKMPKLDTTKTGKQSVLVHIRIPPQHLFDDGGRVLQACVLDYEAGVVFCQAVYYGLITNLLGQNAQWCYIQTESYLGIPLDDS